MPIVRMTAPTSQPQRSHTIWPTIARSDRPALRYGGHGGAGCSSIFTVKGRKWVVTDSRGEVTAVEGDGVVGQFPKIESREKFNYNSFHMIETRTATAEGSYLGIDGQGQTVLVRIPRFIMQVPSETFLV